MDTSSLVEFPETEEAYRAWLDGNQQGFVINAWKDPANKPPDTLFMIWHHADCPHIYPPEMSMDKFVSGEVFKACSINPVALAIWAKGRSEPDLYYCTRCHTAWLREQGESGAQSE